MKIKLGEKMGEGLTAAKPSEVFYPTIRITKKPGGYSVGDEFSGSVSGTVKEVRVKDDGTHECTLELHEINMKSGGKKEFKEGSEAFDDAMKNARKKPAASKPDEDDDEDY